MTEFAKSEQALIDDLHNLEDRLEWMLTNGGETDRWIVEHMRRKIADGKGALFVLQQVVGKYRSQGTPYTIERAGVR